MRKFNGFSLMEMMVVLLIVAIVMAASAPMISKRMIRTAEGGSPWLFSGMNNNIFFNGSGNNNRSVMIGTTQNPGNNSRLAINIGNPAQPSPVLTAVDDSNNILASIIYKDGSLSFNNNNNNVQLGSNVIAFGTGQNISLNGNNAQNINNAVVLGARTRVDADGTIAIGSTSNANVDDITYAGQASSIAIGTKASAGVIDSNQTSENSIAIGNNAVTGGYKDNNKYVPRPSNSSIAIGSGAEAAGTASIAIGRATKAKITNISDANGVGPIAIGIGAEATAVNSVAIGNGAVNNRANVIQLGTENQTVYIPGRLVVGGISYLGYGYKSNSLLLEPVGKYNYDSTSALYANLGSRYDQVNGQAGPVLNTHNDDAHLKLSDRRLKNVGEMFTGGLEQVKKLEVYNFTFKKDSANTPRVGVMAQDLMKVFPNAVTKGEDGYLRIRMEDMFYAVVNAVKELDNKLTAIVEQLKTIADDMSIIKNKNTEYERVITELVEQNKALMKKNSEFEERLAKLEGKAIKKENKEMTKAVKQESKLAKQEEKAKLKAQKQAEKAAQKAAKKAEKEGKK